MHNWIAGEEVTADKLNQLNPETNTRISQAEHNILELFLENYFANKNTPFQGLFFDGFSDTNKDNPAAGVLTAQAAAGQAVAPLVSQGQLDTFTVGDTVHIYDGTHQELGVVQSKGNATITVASEPALASGWAYTEGDPDGDYSDAGVVSGRHRINMNYLQGHNGGSTSWQMAKAFSGLSVGATYTITFQAFSLAGNPYQHYQYDWDYLQVLIDSTQIFNSGAHGGTAATGRDDPTNGQTVSVTFTATATSHTIKIWFGSHYTNIPMSYFELWNFAITQVAPALTLASNLANTYAAGSNVKTTSATLDTTNKKLAMTAGVGDLKRTIYTSKKQSFFQTMQHAKMWIMRAVPARFNPLSTLANGATQATIQNVNVKNKFAVGDIIEISDPVNRERKTVSSLIDNTGGCTVDGTSATGGGSWQHTINAHGNQYLVVKFFNNNYTYRGNNRASSVTWGSQNLTKLGEHIDFGSGACWEIWYLANPTAGTDYITVNETYPGNSLACFAENVYNCQGVDTFAFGTTPMSVTDNNANDLITEITAESTTATMTPGTGQTADGSQQNAGGYGAMASYKAGANGTVTMSESLTNQLGMVTAICRQSTPQVTLGFSPAVQTASGFNTSANIDRVDVFAKISLVVKDAPASLQDPTLIQSLDTILTGNEIMVEDEYQYDPGSVGHDLTVQLTVTRSDTAAGSYAKNLGVSLNA
jgi:hypothetical protein